MGNPKIKNFLQRARTWATQHRLFGQQAFIRFVMFNYLDALRRISDDFVFKGGNLLWNYIQTPRATVDLDLSTRTLDNHTEVEALLRTACESFARTKDGIQFEIKTFMPVDLDDKQGAAVVVKFQTDTGAANEFHMDVVYKISDQYLKIQSMIDKTVTLNAATIENIIADKLLTAEKFGSGNTRMKDFDDLWRLSQNSKIIDAATLKVLLNERNSSGRLQTQWISENMSQSWKIHCRRYKDLPTSLDAVFFEINRWLGTML